MRYPARGDEGASRRSYYGLRLPLHLAGAADEVLWADVQAPGETKWQRVVTALVKAVKTQPERFPWPTNLRHGEYLVWLDQAPVKEPSPTLEQLADLEGLSLVSYEHEDPLVLTPLPRPDDAKLTVVLQD